MIVVSFVSCYAFRNSPKIPDLTPFILRQVLFPISLKELHKLAHRLLQGGIGASSSSSTSSLYAWINISFSLINATQILHSQNKTAERGGGRHGIVTALLGFWFQGIIEQTDLPRRAWFLRCGIRIAWFTVTIQWPWEIHNFRTKLKDGLGQKKISEMSICFRAYEMTANSSGCVA